MQCLSNTTPLTEYFIGTQAGYKPYKKHINRENPLGMGGAIAEAYGALLDDIWSGKTSCVAPRHFKVTDYSLYTAVVAISTTYNMVCLYMYMYVHDT